MANLIQVEAEFGRDRTAEQRWGPRTLDLDLLMYADRIVQTAELTLPHPRMHDRRFVLEPLFEIAPEVVVPGLAATVAQLLDRLMSRGPIHEAIP